MRTIVEHVEPPVVDEGGLRSLLTAALEEEVELLDTLRGLFVSQREALSEGDPIALDDGVFAATRVLRTLDEARRRRLGVTRELLGADVDLDELDTVLTGSSSRPLRIAQERLRRAAGDLRGEVALLRRILHLALSDNRRYLNTLVGMDPDQTDEGDAYGQPAPDVAGALLDRTG